MQIIVTGSLAFDQIMLFPGAFIDHIMPDKLHVMSVSFIVEKLHKNFGGVAGNISYNLALLGHNPICLSTAGKDGHDYKAYLEKNGVNTEYFKVNENDYTSSFVLITDKKDCQIAGFYPGAMRSDPQLPLEEVLDKTADNFLIIAPTTPEAMSKNVDTAIQKNVPYLYSPAQQIPYIQKEDLLRGIEGAEILIGNDYEIALIEKKAEISKEEIKQKVKILITTLGERGSVIEQKDSPEIAIGVAKPRVIKDPTGAGDAFIAGFLSAYLDKKILVECGQYAATAAIYALEEYGTTNHRYSLNLFENRLKENFG
jgi:adenosine kinase